MAAPRFPGQATNLRQSSQPLQPMAASQGIQQQMPGDQIMYDDYYDEEDEDDEDMYCDDEEEEYGKSGEMYDKGLYEDDYESDDSSFDE